MSASISGSSEFAGWRAYLWPVHRHELKKLIPMLLIFFLISFDYNILRTLKDTLVVTAKDSGAEVIPFIKVWVMFPGALLMTFLFTRLSNRLNLERVVYVMIGVFLTYFLVFIALLYPAKDYLHPHQTADALSQILPLGLKGMIAMFRYWVFTSFYVMSELWSNIILSMLFWGFANQVTKVGEAARFYGLFGIGANFSGVAAGGVSVWLSQIAYNPYLPYGTNSWEQSMLLLIGLVIIAGLGSMVIFRWMNRSVLKDALTAETLQYDKEKERLSLRESLRYLLGSKYLMCVAGIVVSYNLVINLIEVIWKHEVRALYPNPGDYNLYMNQVTTWIGVLATLSALFISGNSLRKFGWTFTAMLTPAILFITSIGFFSFFFLKESSSDMLLPFLGTPLMMVVFFGSCQNMMSRAAKYSVFDATKEMAFVPLQPECKVKGKAAIDGVCSRLGKSGGSLAHQMLLVLFSTHLQSNLS